MHAEKMFKLQKQPGRVMPSLRIEEQSSEIFQMLKWRISHDIQSTWWYDSGIFNADVSRLR